jgi:chromate reductase
MYTIIAATNRVGKQYSQGSQEYQRLFADLGVDANLYSMEQFTSLHRDEQFNDIERDLLIPTQKFVFIMPEYNGSFPGIFKLMMDISDITKCWYHKKVMLVGVANGRAGNLRGIDNMTNMCHYMKMNVFHQKLPISSVSNELVDDRLVNENTIKAVQSQIESFINY